VINLRQPLLWAMLVCVLFLNASAVHSQEASRKRGESWQATQDKTDCEQVRKMVQQLTAEVEPLKKKVAELDKYRQVDYLRDLLVKEDRSARRTIATREYRPGTCRGGIDAAGRRQRGAAPPAE